MPLLKIPVDLPAAAMRFAAVLLSGVVLLMARSAGAADIDLTADHVPGEDWNTAAKWSDGNPPSAANDYFTQGFLLKTPTVNSAAQNFAGASLTISPGGTLELNTPHSGTSAPGTFTSVGNVIFAGGTLTGTSFGGGNVQWLGGNADFTNDTLVDLSHGDRVRIGWVGGTWTGSGNITMTGNDPGINSNDLLFLSGVNGSAHTGDWFITESRLIVAGGNNLGDSSRITLGLRGGLDVRGNSTETIGSLASSETSSRVRNGQDGTFGILQTGGDNSDTTFAGIIENGSGTIGLVKQGAGTFTLTNNNTYSGATVIEGGVLRVQGQLGGSTPVQINAAGELEINNSSPWAWGADISGTGIIRKTGGVAFRTFGDNSGFTGTIVVEQGEFRAGSNTAFGTGAEVLVNGGQLALNGWSVTIGSLAGSGGQVMNIATAGAGTDSPPILAVGTLNTDTTFAGQITQDIGLTKVGTGTLSLTNNSNNYTGPTRVEGGLLRIAPTGGGMNFGSDVELAGGNVAFSSGGGVHFARDISGTGNFTVEGGATFYRFSGDNSFTGDVLLQGRLRVGSPTSLGNSANPVTMESGSFLDLNRWTTEIGSLSGIGTVRNEADTGAGPDTNPVLITGGNNASTTFGGVIINGGGGNPVGLTKRGTGTFTLTNSGNSYTGLTSIEGGTLLIQQNGRISNNSDVVISAGATLELQTTNWLYTGSISGAGGLTKSGNFGDNRLTGNNTYTGPTLVTGTGILRAGSNQSFGDNSALTVEGPAIVELNGWSTAFGSLSGNGTIRNQPGANGPGSDSPTVLTTGGDHSDTSFSGSVLDGSGGVPLALTKTGTGTQTLAGTASHSGPTQVEDGTLNVTGAITNTSAVLVLNDGRLSGDGTIITTGNSTTIDTGSTLSPGDAALFGTGELLLQTSSLTFAPGSFWEVNIAGADHGRLLLDSPSVLDLSDAILTAGTTSFDFLVDGSTGYWILDTLGAGFSGQFANMTADGPAAALFPGADGFVDLAGTSFAVFLNAGLDGSGLLTEGNGVVLFAVPEPGRALLLAVAGLLALARRRR